MEQLKILTVSKSIHFRRGVMPRTYVCVCVLWQDTEPRSKNTVSHTSEEERRAEVAKMRKQNQKEEGENKKEGMQATREQRAGGGKATDKF